MDGIHKKQWPCGIKPWLSNQLMPPARPRARPAAAGRGARISFAKKRLSPLTAARGSLMILASVAQHAAAKQEQQAVQCPRGGIGRRAWFRSMCRKVWGFESLRGHHRIPQKSFIGPDAFKIAFGADEAFFHCAVTSPTAREPDSIPAGIADIFRWRAGASGRG